MKPLEQETNFSKVLLKSNFSVVAAVANQSGAMEADTISKNGRSSKSQMSRENKKLFVLFILIASTFVFSSCSSSSPEKDGIKVAKKRCDCERVRLDVSQKQLEISQKEYSKFVKDFNSYNFVNRVDFRNKCQEIANNIQQMNNEASEPYNECLQKAEEYYRKENEKYATNQQKKEQFEYARNNYLCEEVKNVKLEALNSQLNNLMSQIESLRLSIIPPKPEIEKIKNDLVNKSIFKKDDYYYDYSTLQPTRRQREAFWSTKLEHIKEVEILNATGSGDEYLLLVYLRLNMGPGYISFDGNVNITYKLANYDDWLITKTIETVN